MKAKFYQFTIRKYVLAKDNNDADNRMTEFQNYTLRIRYLERLSDDDSVDSAYWDGYA